MVLRQSEPQLNRLPAKIRAKRLKRERVLFHYVIPTEVVVQGSLVRGAIVRPGNKHRAIIAIVLRGKRISDRPGDARPGIGGRPFRGLSSYGLQKSQANEPHVERRGNLPQRFANGARNIKATRHPDQTYSRGRSYRNTPNS